MLLRGTNDITQVSVGMDKDPPQRSRGIEVFADGTYSITRMARSKTDCGIVSPSILAVF